MNNTPAGRLQTFVEFSVESPWWLYLVLYGALRYFGYASEGVAWILLALLLLDCFRAWHTRAAAEPPRTVPRAFVPDPAAAIALYGRQGYDVLRRMNPFLGKWLEVRGRFLGAANSLESEAIHVSVELENGLRINLRFPREARDALSALREGQSVRALTCVGAVPNSGNGYIAFDRSEILAPLTA